MTFEIKDRQFLKDGREIKLISGAVHYFRNLPGSWDGIFKKMRACGCNCVETYCVWNQHEKKPGEFDFRGQLDIARFIRAAGENGLMVIVRPGPYICAEWEFGGLPWWLQTEEDIEIRCMNPTYIRYFDRYLDKLFEQLRPLLCTAGGPIIMLQCENEYGYYGDDKPYLEYLRDGYRRRGIDVPLFTSDGPSAEDLLDGSIDGCLAALNFGSDPDSRFKDHERLFPDMPEMCMEMWDGWFDAWGDSAHHTTSAENYAKEVAAMLRRGSLNMYMFIGGTNFGFTSGANHNERFAPDVTSYDYDALLSECGDVTEKYLAVREVIAPYAEAPLPDIPPDRPKKAYGPIRFTGFSGLFESLDRLSAPLHSDVPRCMEHYGQGCGYIAYQSVLRRDYRDALLSFESLGDRAQIYRNRELIGICCIDGTTELRLSARAGDLLTVLCENMGRANFGSRMMRKKGLAGRCLLDGRVHFGWEVYPLPMDNCERLLFTDRMPEEQSVFCRGSLSVDEPADSFLALPGFTKGFVLINGFNIGRYWDIGPQKTLYVPAELIHPGDNEIVVFESDGLKAGAAAEFRDRPELG